VKNWYHEDVSCGYPAIAIFDGTTYSTYIFKPLDIEKIWYPDPEEPYWKGLLKPKPKNEEEWTKRFVDNCWIECPQKILLNFYESLAIQLLGVNDVGL
jgi:hypothetical protein